MPDRTNDLYAVGRCHPSAEIGRGIAEPHSTLTAAGTWGLHDLLPKHRIGREVLSDSLGGQRGGLPTALRAILGNSNIPDTEDIQLLPSDIRPQNHSRRKDGPIHPKAVCRRESSR